MGRGRTGGTDDRRHLRALHPLPDRDHADHGRHPVRRARGLPAAAGRAAAAGRFPDHPGHGATARRQPRDHGVLGGAAAGAAVRADPGRDADDLDQLARHRRRSPCSSTSTATSTPPPATSRRRSTRPAGSCRKNLPSPPTYRKVNPADSPILMLSAHLRHAAADRRRTTTSTPQLAQQISQISGVGAGLHRRPAEAGGPGPGRSGQARRQGPVARRRARPARDHRPSNSPKGTIDGDRRAAYTIYANDQLTDGRRTGTTSSSPTATARRSGCATSARRSTGPEDTKQAGLGQRQARRVPGRSSSSPAPTSSTPSTGSRRSCRGSTAAIPPAIKIDDHQRPHPDHPRLGARTCSSRCC